MNKSLLALAIVTFSLGISEFGMMGILEEVSAGVNVDVVKGGELISAYSLGVAAGSPGLILLRRWPLKRLLLLLVGIIFTGNLCATLSPDFNMLIFSRLLSGLPHGAYFGAAAIVAERLVPEGRQATAVAIMVGGMTVANVVGVPLSTFLANVLNWRLAFLIVSLCALTAFICIRMWVPRLDALPDSGLKGQFRFLSRPAPWLIYTGVFFGQASVYCWLSYINPIMTRVASFPASSMTMIMVVVGLGMVFGNAVTGRLSDKYPAALVTGVTAALLVIIMPAIYLLSPYKVPSVVLSFIAPACLFGIGGPLQYLIVKYAKGGEMLGGAGIQIAFNVSNAVAASAGGYAISRGLGFASPALLGVPCAVIGAAALILLYKKFSY